MSEKIIGIDLGTTNSCVAVIVNGQTVVIPNSEGHKTTSSIVAFRDGGEKLVGQLAKRQAIMNPERTIESIKRKMGSKFRAEIEFRSFTPEQISALILQKLRKQAQDFLGERISKAIITVPAYFDDAQRLATADAGQIAGLEIVRMITEPTACALTYGLHRSTHTSTNVVFDFGGGTFDVTILEISQGVLHVKSTNGNNQLGGDDFDNKVSSWIKDRVKAQYAVDLSGDPCARQRIKEAAEIAKVELSSRESTNIQLPFLSVDSNNMPVNFEATLTREEFNRLTKDLVEAARAPVMRALEDAHLSPEKIDNVILAGGTTRIPLVQALIKDIFHKDPLKVVNPDEAVATGAAIQGGIITGELEGILLLDVVPMSMGMEKKDGKVANIFKRNIVIPIDKKFTLTNESERQSAIRIHVVQGEEELAANNKSIARFTIPLKAPMPPKSAKFEVSFQVNVDGIFFCNVIDKKTNEKIDIDMVRTNGLSREELRLLSEDAAKEAKIEQDAIERNQAAMLAQCSIAEADRMLSKYADKLDTATQTKVRQTVSGLRSALLESEVDEIHSALKLLQSLITECTRSAVAVPRRDGE